MRCWHFLPNDFRLRFKDSREAKIGVWLRAIGTVKLNKNGMHGAKTLMDALDYAPGVRLCRVEVDGEIAETDRYLVGRRRKVLAWLNARDVLLEFRRWCAKQVADKWGAPPVVRNYLNTGENRAAAKRAIEAAGRDASATSTSAAAWASARATVQRPETITVQAATQEAAEAAAHSFSEEAAANTDEVGEARETIREEARATARDAQNTRLTAMVNAAME